MSAGSVMTTHLYKSLYSLFLRLITRLAKVYALHGQCFHNCAQICAYWGRCLAEMAQGYDLITEVVVRVYALRGQSFHKCARIHA